MPIESHAVVITQPQADTIEALLLENRDTAHTNFGMIAEPRALELARLFNAYKTAQARDESELEYQRDACADVPAERAARDERERYEHDMRRD